MALSAPVDYGLCDDPRTSEKWDGILQPVTWTEADTDLTIADAKRHNAVGKELCGDQWGR